MAMKEFGGEILLNTFTDLNVDLRNLSPNVIEAWFDTDCDKTRDLLNWLCVSLSNLNYVSPLEKAEFDTLEEQLSSKTCAEELANLNPKYLSILSNEENLEDLLIIQDAVDLLEDENKHLDKLITTYENIESSFSSDITQKTRREIQSKVECKKSQEICEDLSKSLDEYDKKLQKMLVKYDPDSHIVNFIDVNDCLEDLEKINSIFELKMEIDKSLLEDSDEYSSEELEVCRKRILHSHQIYLANKIETEKLKGLLDFLCKTNLNENLLSWGSLNINTNLMAKDLYKKKMYEVLDRIASKLADRYLQRARLLHLEQEYKELQQRKENVSKNSRKVTQYLSYYVALNCLQFEEKKQVECINGFYQKMINYINEDLYRCRARTDQMNLIIEEYNSYHTKQTQGNSKLISSIANILSSEGYTLKSVAAAVGKFKTELNLLESQMFCSDLKNEVENRRNTIRNIKKLEEFLISGATTRVVLVPLDLQKVWSEIEEHLKKENASIAQAVHIPQSVPKTMTKAQNYTKRLWMHFLTDPSKMDSVLKQAEEDFKKRTQQYF